MAEETAQSGGAGRKRLTTLLVGAVALVLAAGGGAVFMLVADIGGGDTSRAEGEKPPARELYRQKVPQMIVGLDGDRHSRVQLQVAIQVDTQAGKSAVKRMSPRLMDSFRSHISGLTAAELEGEAATEALRQALLKRTRDAVSNAKVHGILFKQFLVH